MPVYHRTQRLQIFGEKPEIQKLYGSRYRMVVRCVAKNDTKAWYDDNKAQIFADFGSLYSAQMSVDGIDARTGEAYDDMVLVKNEATYTRSGEYVIVFTYETLTDSFVKETEDKVDFDLNGLKRLTRTIIAKDTVAYSSVVGTTTILGSSPLLTLAQVSEDQLEASEDGFKRIREVWLESGTLSETLDNVGSQKAKVIETIGADPATPSGYSLASKQESDFEGFQTNRFTFLKPSILSLQQDFNNGLKRVSVQAFGMTATSVSAELAAITSSHALISQTESDYEGIKTSTFQYQIDEAFTEDYELNGLKRISLIELSASDFSAQTVGGVSTTAPTTGLYLGTQNIDNGGIINVRESVWLESGVTSVSTDEDSITDEVVVNALNLSAAQVRTAVTEVTANHSLKSQSTNDFEGLNSFRYVFEIRSTTAETELGDSQIGVNFYTGVQTDGSSDFIIERQYSISSSNTTSSIKKLIPPEINDPVFDGTGGTQKAYIVDQEVKPNGKDGAVLTRTFAMLPTHLDEWDEMVVRFPGVSRGPFQLDEGFAFRSQPYSEAVPVRICRDFYLSNPQRICRPDEFRPVDKNGNRVTVLTADTVPTADEYIGYVNSGKYLNDRVSIHRWQGDIWERRITQFKAE